MARKRSREVLKEEKRDFELTELTLGDAKWRKIIKKLTVSDLNDLCRLILPGKQVENYILPFIFSEEHRNKVDTNEGLPVTIVDEHYGSEHYLIFKKWPSSKSYVLVSNWRQEFVKRLGLTKNHWIQIYWSKYSQCFFFSVPQQEQQPPSQPQPQPRHWLRLMNDVDDGLQLAVMIQDQHQKQQQQQPFPLRIQPLQSIPLLEANTDDRLHQLHPPPQLRPLMEVVTTEDRLQQLHHHPQLLLLMDGIDDERLPLMDVSDNERLQRHPPNKKQKSTAPCLFPNWVDDTANDDGLNLELTL